MIKSNECAYRLTVNEPGANYNRWQRGLSSLHQTLRSPRLCVVLPFCMLQDQPAIV